MTDFCWKGEYYRVMQEGDGILLDHYMDNQKNKFINITVSARTPYIPQYFVPLTSLQLGKEPTPRSHTFLLYCVIPELEILIGLAREDRVGIEITGEKGSDLESLEWQAYPIGKTSGVGHPVMVAKVELIPIHSDVGEVKPLGLRLHVRDLPPKKPMGEAITINGKTYPPLYIISREIDRGYYCLTTAFIESLGITEEINSLKNIKLMALGLDGKPYEVETKPVNDHTTDRIIFKSKIRASHPDEQTLRNIQLIVVPK